MPGRIASSVAVVAARTSSVLGPRFMRRIARFNKRVTNPVQHLWAPRLRRMAFIEHIGRKSGKVYQTPVMAFIENRGLVVVLNYGENSDWVRNVQSAGSAVVIHQGKRYNLTDPRVVPIGCPDLPPDVRAIGGSAHTALQGTLTPA